MGSASSRMSANPALVHPGRASDASTASTSTSTSTVTASTSTSTIQQSSTSTNDAISESVRIATPPDTPPIVTMKLDKGKGKEIMEDKEEGEISEDETLPIHIAKPPSISSTKRSSPARPAYDSYRPQHRPRGSSQPQYPPQYPRSQPPQPTHRMHQSQSPQQLQFQQQSQPNHLAQHGQNGHHYQQQHISRLGNGSTLKSPISPKTVETIPGIHTPIQAKPVPINDRSTSPKATTATFTQSPPEDSLALPSSKSSDTFYCKC
jgi:hypothetical protein